MPIRVTDQCNGVEHHSLRWARQHSDVLNGTCCCRPSLARWPSARTDRRGRELCGSLHGPGWIYFAGHDITSERKKDFGTSAPTTRPQKTGVLHQDNRLQLEWIVLGCTAE